MKTRYKVHLKDGPQIRKNPSEQDIQLWESQGIKVEKLEGYETFTPRDADPDLLISMVDDKIKAHLANVRRQLDIQSEKLEKLTKTVDDIYSDQDEILEILDEDETLAKGTRMLAILGVVIAVIALVKGFL